MAKGRSQQISFRADDELASKIQAASKVEEIPVADFVRKIFRFAFKEYQTAGSLYALRVRVDAAAEAKRQVALEDELRGKKSESAPKKNRKAS